MIKQMVSELIEVTENTFLNCSELVAGNSSVRVHNLSYGTDKKITFGIELKVLSTDDHSPRAVHEVEGDSVITGFTLTPNGAYLLHRALELELRKNKYF